MSTTIGIVQELTKTQFTFEWRIDDFFSLSEEHGKFYNSPDFFMDGEYWYLQIYPNGESRNNSVGYVSVYLTRRSSGPSKNLTTSFALKVARDKKACVKQCSHEFTMDTARGHPRFLKRSELLESRDYLIPDGVLTVIFSREVRSKSTYDADSDVKACCSYCKKYFQDERFSSHEEMCLSRPIRCPSCTDVVELRQWFNHKCPFMRVKANEKLVEDMTVIFNAQEHSDVTIQVKDKEFHLHKNILAGRNSYFKSMLSTEMQERSTGTIIIKDCEPEDYRSFIHFIYTGKVDSLSVDNVCALYELADKYQEDLLKEECVRLMRKEMRTDTFCDFIAVALRHEEKELFKDAAELFCRKIEEIIPNVKWESIVTQYPSETTELTVKAVNRMSDKLKEKNAQILNSA